MDIEILQGYENSFSNEKNSVSIQIKTDLLLNNYLKKAIEKVDILYIIFFSVRERAVFYKSCDLIGSGSGRYSPIRPAHSGRYPMRDESSITSLTSLQFFINYKDTYHENL